MAARRPNSTPVSRKDAFLSRQEIEGLIANGRKVIIVDGKVLKVDAWLKYHPGGDKAIMHMIGRDATDEVNAYVEAPLSKISEINWLTLEADCTRLKLADEWTLSRLAGFRVDGRTFCPLYRAVNSDPT